MKFTDSMFRGLVDTSLGPIEIGDVLTMLGHEVESIETIEDEAVIDVNVMANRGDVASVLGLAREFLAKQTDAEPTALYRRLAEGLVAGDEDVPEVGRFASIRVETPLCARYACRVFEGLTNGDSPEWLQSVLRRIGQRPISLLVDVTNYVMFETGQPLHAFDLGRLTQGQVLVREATTNESIETLDGSSRKLAEGMVVITDGSRPIAVAGVMGGATTEVSATTTRCLLESAHFDNSSVRRTRRALGMHTESSYRFERWVDPAGVVRALNRVNELLVAAGQPGAVPGVIDVRSPATPAPVVSVRASRCTRLLGFDVEPTEALDTLARLGFEPQIDGEAIRCTSPTWRIDVTREEDLAEEVGRVLGYGRIPEAILVGSVGVGGTHGPEARIDHAVGLLLRSGLTQALCHTLRDVHVLDRGTARVQVKEPHSPETALLRDSLLPGLAEVACRNGGRNLHLFEVGRVFGDQTERRQLAVLSTGGLDGPSWAQPATPQASFSSMKGILERSLGDLGDLEPGADPRFHATRHVRTNHPGVFGQIHPDLAEAVGLPELTWIAEIDLEDWAATAPPVAEFRTLHRHPAVRRDIAIVVASEVAYATLEHRIGAAGGPDLETMWLFDVYSGPGVPEGHVSLAIALQFRRDGNLTDEDANLLRDAIVAAIAQDGARLR